MNVAAGLIAEAEGKTSANSQWGKHQQHCSLDVLLYSV